jgi:hypothetical protein
VGAGERRGKPHGVRATATTDGLISQLSQTIVQGGWMSDRVSVEVDVCMYGVEDEVRKGGCVR